MFVDENMLDKTGRSFQFYKTTYTYNHIQMQFISYVDIDLINSDSPVIVYKLYRKTNVTDIATYLLWIKASMPEGHNHYDI